MLFTYYSCQLSCRLSGTQKTHNDEPHGVLEHYPGCSLLDIQVSREVVILTQSTSTLLHLKSKMCLHFYHNCYVFNTSFMYFQVNLQHGSFSFSLTFGSGSINSRKKRLLIKRNMSNILRPYLVKWRMFGCGLLPVVLTSSLISSTS